jgi:hypothetical protein
LSSPAAAFSLSPRTPGALIPDSPIERSHPAERQAIAPDCLSHSQRQLSQVAIAAQDVEGVKLHFVIAVAAMQAIETGSAVGTPEQDSFTIQDECAHPDPTRGFYD